MSLKIIYYFNTTNLILKLYSDGLSISKIVKKIKFMEFIPWLENIKKRTKCSITIEDLKLL